MINHSEISLRIITTLLNRMAKIFPKSISRHWLILLQTALPADNLDFRFSWTFLNAAVDKLVASLGKDSVLEDKGLLVVEVAFVEGFDSVGVIAYIPPLHRILPDTHNGILKWLALSLLGLVFETTQNARIFCFLLFSQHFFLSAKR